MHDHKFRRQLFDRSPLKHARHLNTPLYIWAGARGPIVPVSQIKDYVLAQVDHQKHISLMIDRYSAHGPSTELSMLGYLAWVEAVLNRYLDGNQQVIDVPRLRKHMQSSLVVYSSGWLSQQLMKP